MLLLFYCFVNQLKSPRVTIQADQPVVRSVLAHKVFKEYLIFQQMRYLKQKRWQLVFVCENMLVKRYTAARQH